MGRLTSGEMSARRVEMRALARTMAGELGRRPTNRELAERAGLSLKAVYSALLGPLGEGLTRRATPGGRSLRADASKAPNLERMAPADRDAWLIKQRDEVRDAWPAEVERVRRGLPLDGLTVGYQDRGYTAKWKGSVTA
jgi:hypothetical protein